jgi:transitional endoplasmic reticulum ATPase
MTRAVATHAEAHVERLSGPALASMRPEETAERLREAFAEATAAAPAMVVVDDVDALGDSDRLPDETVPKLLERMAALDRRSRTLVVATTTRPDEVDPALRRPGRLADEIEVGIPDRDGREEILERHTRALPLAAGVDLGAYAERTHGFVGADLVSLVREGLLCALRRRGAVDALDVSDGGETRHGDADGAGNGPERGGGSALVGDGLDLDLDGDRGVSITPADLECAFRATEPSALRELLVEVPEVSWADVGGLEEVKARLQESVQWPLAYADAFERVSLRPPTGILLYGPPGTGKTLLAKAVANEADSNFVSVKGPELLDKYVGESEKGVREVFAKARENAPTVVFFDEIDAIAAERGGGSGDSGVGERIVSQLLTELDGLEDLTDVIVVATTNRPGLVDDALLRPGRFDRHIHVGVPDAEARREILAVHTAGRPLADDVDLDAVAAETEGYVGADVEAVCREAATAAVREHVATGSAVDDIVVTAAHFETALAEVDPSGDGDGRFEAFAERVDDGV